MGWYQMCRVLQSEGDRWGETNRTDKGVESLRLASLPPSVSCQRVANGKNSAGND